MERYSSYKDSGVSWIGMIPEHWKQYRFAAICKEKSICNCVNEELLSVYLDRGVIRFSDDTNKRTNPTSKDLSKYQLVEVGDFVLNNQQAWRGSVGVSDYRGIVSPAYFIFSLACTAIWHNPCLPLPCQKRNAANDRTEKHRQ